MLLLKHRQARSVTGSVLCRVDAKSKQRVLRNFVRKCVIGLHQTWRYFIQRAPRQPVKAQGAEKILLRLGLERTISSAGLEIHGGGCGLSLPIDTGNTDGSKGFFCRGWFNDDVDNELFICRAAREIDILFSYGTSYPHSLLTVMASSAKVRPSGRGRSERATPARLPTTREI